MVKRWRTATIVFFMMRPENEKYICCDSNNVMPGIFRTPGLNVVGKELF